MKPLPDLTPAEIATGVRSLITITPTLPLHEALELIDKHRINSLVVTSHSDASKFTGIINTFDIVDFVVRFTTPKESTLSIKQEKLNQPVDYLLGLDGEKESYRIKEFDRHDNLSKLLKTFGKKYHRVLVVDFGCPDTVPPYILTQTDIVRYADSHPESLQYVDLNQSLKESGIIKLSINIIRLTESNTASDGFKLMVENGLTSLPILNSEGKLVANLRAYDAKHIVKLGIEALDWPVLQYLEKSSDGIAPVIASTVDAPLQEIVRKLVIGGVHHVWILSKEGALENVVSMTDLCRYFAVKDKQA